MQIMQFSMVIPKPASESHLFLHHHSNLGPPRHTTYSLPRLSMPKKSMAKEAAYRNIHDKLQLDANPKLNLASFVTTSMEEECNKLIMESINKNYVNMDEYPATTDLHVLTLIFSFSFIISYIILPPTYL